MRKSPFVVKESGQTYNDYAALPESAGRFELLDGELLAMSAAPTTTHQMVSGHLYSQLYKCDSDYLVLAAPVDVILSDYSVLQPDLILVHRNRTQIITQRGIEGPPDLVVEILSPTTAKRDRGKKMELYAHYGVGEYWIVDAANRLLEQYLLDNQQFRLHNVYPETQEVSSPTISCVSFTMQAILARMPENLTD